MSTAHIDPQHTTCTDVLPAGRWSAGEAPRVYVRRGDANQSPPGEIDPIHLQPTASDVLSPRADDDAEYESDWRSSAPEAPPARQLAEQTLAAVAAAVELHERRRWKCPKWLEERRQWEQQERRLAAVSGGRGVAVYCREQARRRLRRILSDSPCWLVSAVIHAGAALLLASLTVSADRDSGVQLLGWEQAPEPKEMVDFTVAKGDPFDAAARAGVSAPRLRAEPDPVEPGPLSLQAPYQSRGPVTEAAALFADSSSSSPARRPVAAFTGGAGFFGLQAAGERFVFVVDCSASMHGEKWRRTREELLRSISALSADQSFYVIFFDADSHRMFGQREDEASLVPATPANIARFEAWMATVGLDFFTEPLESVRCALNLNPDAIFLLSDGEFTEPGEPTDPTARYLRVNNVRRQFADGTRRRTAVHTIAIQNREGGKLLENIARQNAGAFRMVSLDEE